MMCTAWHNLDMAVEHDMLVTSSESNTTIARMCARASAPGINPMCTLCRKRPHGVGLSTQGFLVKLFCRCIGAQSHGYNSHPRVGMHFPRDKKTHPVWCELDVGRGEMCGV